MLQVMAMVMMVMFREAVGPEGQRQEHSTKDTYDSLKQFLHHDRKVLRYFAHSETPFTPLGKTYKKKYVICFFLSDNSLEVTEHQSLNLADN